MRGSRPASVLLLIAAAAMMAAGPAPSAPGSDPNAPPPPVQLLLDPDSDGDGIPDASDCRPLDNSLWTIPSPAQDLTITGSLPSGLAWSGPASPGGTVVFYDLLMSGSPGSWSGAACLESSTTSTSGTCNATPSPGQALYYLVRTKNACGENMGTDGSGAPRTGGACGLFPRPDGEPCAVDAECSGDHCVDGFCCENACGGPCESCGQAGREGFCDPVPYATDPDGDCPASPPSTCATTGGCDGAGACELYPAGTGCAPQQCVTGTTLSPGATCDGLGSCVPFPDVSCEPYLCELTTDQCRTECTSILHCYPGYECKLPEGECRLPDGESCNDDSQCTSGYCTDGVCCNSRCDGICKRCDLSPGTCQNALPGTDPDGDCPSQPPTSCETTGVCSGAGDCELWPAGTTCMPATCTGPVTSDPEDQCNGLGACVSTPPQDCSPYACATGPGTCLTQCASSADCAANATCLVATGECLLNDGESCSLGSQCYNGACCGGFCTNLATDTANCGSCGNTCTNPHGSTSCAGGVCNPVCDTLWGSCDGDPDDGCQESLTTLTNCGGCGHTCYPPHANPSCSTGFCTIVSCNNGYANCNGSTSDGCEVNLWSYPNTCSGAAYVGSKCGDSECGTFCPNSSWETFTTRSGRGSYWFRAYADECSACCADIYARITLTPPSGTDYDLYVYRPCGTLVGSSQNGGSTIDQVTVSNSDDCFAGDDGFYYYVEVRFYSGSSCANWTLRFEGRDC